MVPEQRGISRPSRKSARFKARALIRYTDVRHVNSHSRCCTRKKEEEEEEEEEDPSVIAFGVTLEIFRNHCRPVTSLYYVAVALAECQQNSAAARRTSKHCTGVCKEHAKKNPTRLWRRCTGAAKFFRCLGGDYRLRQGGFQGVYTWTDTRAGFVHGPPSIYRPMGSFAHRIDYRWDTPASPG